MESSTTTVVIDGALWQTSQRRPRKQLRPKKHGLHVAKGMLKHQSDAKFSISKLAFQRYVYCVAAKSIEL